MTTMDHSRSLEQLENNYWGEPTYDSYVDGLEFQTFKMEVEYPSKMVLNVLMFSRLFDKREFAVNIMYVDELKGQRMLDSWRQSKFTR